MWLPQRSVYKYQALHRISASITLASCTSIVLFSGKMRTPLTSIVALRLLATSYAASSAVQGTGSTTRGWSCCKNSCSWSNKAPVSKPVLSCDAQDNFLDNPARRDGCDSGGGSFGCSDLSPWAASADLAYGFAGVNLAASNETAWCCSCYS